MSETLTLAQLEDAIKEARLRGAEDHTPVWKLVSGDVCSIVDVKFTGNHLKII